MVNFPILEQLDIAGFALYPGADTQNPGLHMKLEPGLTLVLGTNGLGKTTLVTIMYRLLTGPYHIPALTNNAELGTARLEPALLPASLRASFAQRVGDGARNATATLKFRIGGSSVLIKRGLRDLSLLEFKVDNNPQTIDEKRGFQQTMPKLAGVWSFGDWLLLLRHLIFYFEDRRALVWDPSAQRQVLRMLFLSAEDAQKWTLDERAVVEVDSHMRNLRAIVSREESSLALNEAKIRSGDQARVELGQLRPLQDEELKELDLLEDRILDLDVARQSSRLRLLKSEQEREAQLREIERVQLDIVGASFPSSSETAKYILNQLISDRECLVCGTEVPEVAREYMGRLLENSCVVCGTDLSGASLNSEPLEQFHSRLSVLNQNLSESEAEVMEARALLDRDEDEFATTLTRLGGLRTSTTERSQRIAYLLKMLPAESSEIQQRQVSLEAMRARVETLREETERKRAAFRKFVAEVSESLVNHSNAVQDAFNFYAREFLFEQCGLVWSPQRALIGQSGTPIEYPAFELEMTGSAFQSPVRRSGPEQVSESQREFIDLAFRMALMAAVGSGGTSIVIDAPESSLDAVFSRRAAAVLGRFATGTSANRLVVTSNLIEGQLIPSLVQFASASQHSVNVVDLLSISVPTAAVREHRDEYAAVRDRLIGR